MANGMKIANLNITVIPAKAGIHFNNAANIKMDPRFREDDEIVKFVVYCKRLISRCLDSSLHWNDESLGFVGWVTCDPRVAMVKIFHGRVGKQFTHPTVGTTK